MNNEAYAMGYISELLKLAALPALKLPKLGVPLSKPPKIVSSVVPAPQVVDTTLASLKNVAPSSEP